MHSGKNLKLHIKYHGEKNFIVENEAEKGYDNFINLIGIKLPGLTSSITIADYILDLIN